MPRSLSKSQIDKLGERLAAAPVASDEDLELLELLRSGDYAKARDGVVTILRSMGVMPGDELTARLKTNPTIIDKLRRGTKLSSMQDLAGVRVVRRMTLAQQDEFVASLTRRFIGRRGETLYKITDRRATPSFGYRAVHVIVQLDSCRVEVQVRTILQHLWAQTFELIADIPAFGRGIRYGSPAASARSEPRTAWLVEQMQMQSAAVAQIETMQDQIAQLPRDLVQGFEQELGVLARNTTDILGHMLVLARSLRP